MHMRMASSKLARLVLWLPYAQSPQACSNPWSAAEGAPALQPEAWVCCSHHTSQREPWGQGERSPT